MALTLVAVPTLSFGGFGVAAPKKGKPVGFAYGARTRPRPVCAPLRPSIPIADGARKFCRACFNGDYPADVSQMRGKLALEERQAEEE